MGAICVMMIIVARYLELLCISHHLTVIIIPLPLCTTIFILSVMAIIIVTLFRFHIFISRSIGSNIF